MKKIILLLSMALVCFAELGLTQNAPLPNRWEPILEFQKSTQQSVISVIAHVDTMNASKKPAFYGGFAKSLIYQSNGDRVVVNSDSPNTSLLNGQSAGLIRFSDTSESTVLNHSTYNGVDYIGTSKADSHGIATSSIYVLKNNIYVPETSIKFSGGAMIFPIGNNKFYITGKFFYGWDKDGQKILASSCIWDKTLGTLTAMGDGIGGFIQDVSVSNKDGTIWIITSSSSEYNLRIIWNGGTDYKDELYPQIPPNGRLIKVYGIDKHNAFVVWKQNFSTDCILYKLNFATKSYVQVATTPGLISSISGDGANKVYLTGESTTINGGNAGSHILEYDIAANTFTTLPELGGADYSRTQIKHLAGQLYLLDEARSFFGYEVVYLFRTEQNLPVKLLTFVGQTTNKTNVLTWSTSEEQNVKHFDLERGTDGAKFTSLSIFVAKGNSSTKTDYSFTDKNPIVGSFNFYRLKIVDIDGKFTYSPIVKLEIKADGTPPIIPPVPPVITPGIPPATEIVFSAYPNPAISTLTVRVPQGLRAAYTILTLRGERLQTSSSVLNSTTMRFDVSRLPSGIYICQMLTENGESKAIKFYKQ